MPKCLPSNRISQALRQLRQQEERMRMINASPGGVADWPGLGELLEPDLSNLEDSKSSENHGPEDQKNG